MEVEIERQRDAGGRAIGDAARLRRREAARAALSLGLGADDATARRTGNSRFCGSRYSMVKGA